MKTQIKLGLVAFIFSITSASAQTNNLVNLTGNIQASYVVEMSEADQTAIAEGLQGINNLPAIKVDVNSIYSEQDKMAFSLATKEVSRVMLEAAKKLVDMRTIVYKLDIALQQDQQGYFKEKIYQTYQEKFQSSFTSLLELFIGKELSFNNNLSTAMEACFTATCLQDIANAQLDLVDFGKSINARIDLNSSKQWEYQSYQFNSRLVKDSVRMTIDEVLKTNEKESAYVKMLRAATTPFAAAASGISTTTSELRSFVSQKTAARYAIFANPVSFKSKQWKEATKAFEVRVGDNYQMIVNQGNGAKKYQDLMIQKEKERKNANTSIPQAFVNTLKKMDAALVRLADLNSLDEKTAIKIVNEVIADDGHSFSSSNRGLDLGYAEVLRQVMVDTLRTSFSNNLYPTDEPTSLLTLEHPISFVKNMSYQSPYFNGYNYIYINGEKEGSLTLNRGEFQYGLKLGAEFKNVDLFRGVATDPSSSDIVHLFRLKSKDVNLNFVIGVIDNPYHYLIKDANGNYRINMNPDAPEVQFSALK